MDSFLQRMIQRFHDQMFQRMSPEKLARKISVMKALAKSVRNKNKENENPINNNMALSYNFKHSTPLKSPQITDLDVVEPEFKADANMAESGLQEIENVLGNESQYSDTEELSLAISDVCDIRDSSSRRDSVSCSESDKTIEAGVTVLALDDLDSQRDKHWRSLEVLHENAEFEFCRSLEESKLFVSTSSLLEEIEADLPSPYSLARPLNYTFHTLTSYRTQARLARMVRPAGASGLGTNVSVPETYRENVEFAQTAPHYLQDVNLSNPEITSRKEIAENGGVHSKKIEYLEVKVMVQKALAEQSEKALNLSRTQKLFGVEHVESEKALLLANLRCNAAVQEAKKLKLLGEVSEKGNFGQVTISQISFEVNTSNGNCPEKYICTATERENVQSTSVINEIVDGKLRFSEPFKFKNLHKDFVITIELFKLFNKEPKKTMLTAALVRKLKKITAVNFNRSLTVSSYSLCGFVSIAQCELRLKNILQRDSDQCILQNNLIGALQQRLAGPKVSLVVKTDLHIESNQRGFLNMFKQTWHRRWFSLSGFFLNSWLYPEDQESDKAPVDSIHLPDCSSVEPVGMDTCIRPHSFVITLKENGGEILFSASSQKDMTTWLDQLNMTLEHIRLWKSNA